MKLTVISKLQMVLFIVGLTTLTSCKKDKDPLPQEITLKTVSGSYKLAGMVTQSANMPAKDGLPDMEPCQVDDIINFKIDRTFTNTDAGLKCAIPNNDSGTWDVPNTTTFVLGGENWLLENFDGKLLIISHAITISGNKEITKVTLRRQ